MDRPNTPTISPHLPRKLPVESWQLYREPVRLQASTLREVFSGKYAGGEPRP